MRLLRRWFGKHQAPARAADIPVAPPASEASCAATSIHKLQAQHTLLREQHARIGHLARAGEFDQARQALQAFRDALEEHLQVENRCLYAWLEDQLKNDAPHTAHLRVFRREMDRIARQTSAYARRWCKADFSDPGRQQQFLHEHAEVAARLDKRMDREENSLFPLF